MRLTSAFILAALLVAGNSLAISGDRTRTLARIGDINDAKRPRPLVTLEEFFEGNDDFGSIGYNFYPDQPRPAEFFEVFRSIRSKPGVATVLVQVQDLEDPAGWPSTDTIWVITSASPNELRTWLGHRFRPDDILIGLPEGKVEKYSVPGGMRALGVWYD